IALGAIAILSILHFDSITSALHRIAGAFMPVIYGGAIAYLLNLIMVRIERLPLLRKEGRIADKVRRPLSIIGSIAIVFLMFGSAITMAALQLKNSAPVLAQGLTTAWNAIAKLVQSFEIEGRLASLFGSQAPDWNSLVEDAAKQLGGVDGIVNSAMGVGDAVFSTAVDVGLGLVFACYLLMAKERALAGANTLSRTVLPPLWQSRAATICSTVNASFSRFISGQCLEALILGSLCTLGMSVLGLPHAFTVGAIVGITALVPIFGAWVGGIIGVLMILPYSMHQTLVFLIFLLVLQQIENHFIYPRTMGNATGISTIWVLAAVVVGASLGGIVGMVIAVPIVAALTQLLKDFWKYESQTPPPAKPPSPTSPNPDPLVAEGSNKAPTLGKDHNAA
ncbi:MAG: AI-2E family transporter, partial [Eggerthellaceae bacterium]|nr:AI-2E family transporter [Eggerthellaceae bacterium]